MEVRVHEEKKLAEHFDYCDMILMLTSCGKVETTTGESNKETTTEAASNDETTKPKKHRLKNRLR
jgi:hypothetical protein